LDLSYAELDDEGLGKLVGLGELVSLNLDSTHVTDAAVELLGKMGKLKDVTLYHSLVTGAGEAKLRGRGLRVIWDKEAGMPHRRRA
jgi:hypothetical protein